MYPGACAPNLRAGGALGLVQGADDGAAGAAAIPVLILTRRAERRLCQGKWKIVLKTSDETTRLRTFQEMHFFSQAYNAVQLTAPFRPFFARKLRFVNVDSLCAISLFFRPEKVLCELHQHLSMHDGIDKISRL